MPETLRIGSLFSGARAGGLDLAVEAVFGGRTVWHCEQDAAASKVLAYRWPGVPNLGDITAVDWAQVEPVDIICGGWPCQPFSVAGKRKGADDERALWPEVARALRVVRPRIVALENVSAVLGPEFSRVADSLAQIGYELRWTCLRASDVGAPHRRERLFAIAHANESGWQRSQSARRPNVFDGRIAADPARDRRHERWSESAGLVGRPDAAIGSHRPVDLLPTPQVADSTGGHATRSGDRADELLLPGVARAYATGALLPTPTSRDHKGANQRGDDTCLHGTLLPTPATADDDRGPDFARADREGSGGDDLVTICARATQQRGSNWGKYEAAIRRWETVTRPAPAPTEPNTKGNPRLAAQFSEWMMGWPAGWVTDPDIGISRNDQLRIIGNGVVPQQATAAISWLLSIQTLGVAS